MPKLSGSRSLCSYERERVTSRDRTPSSLSMELIAMGVREKK